MLITWHGALTFPSFRDKRTKLCAGGIAVVSEYPSQGCVMLHSSEQSSSMLTDQRYVRNVQSETHALQLADSVSVVNPIAEFVLLASSLSEHCDWLPRLRSASKGQQVNHTNSL